MKNINSKTITYLDSLFNETQNNIRLTTAIQKLINGPFPIRANSSNPLIVNKEFLDFLNEGKFTTRIGTKGEERDPFDYILPDSPKDLFIYDQNDVLLTALLNTCIELFVKNDNRENFNTSINEYIQGLYKSSLGLDSNASAEKIRKHFYDNYLFEYNNYGRFKDGAKPHSIANTLLKAIDIRVSSWASAKNRTLDPSNLSQTLKETLIKIEESYLSEYSGYVAGEIAIEGSDSLYSFLSKIIYPDDYSKQDFYYQNIFTKAFGNDVPGENSKERNHFTNVFKGSQVELAANINEKQLIAIMGKIEESGLLHLARYASNIADFAQQRLSSVEQLKKSAIDSVKPERDVAWLTQLSVVLQKISRNPVSLATINIYFPSLVSFFFDALSVSTDYSNNGKGGGEEDSINNLDDFMDSLEKAFGRTVDFQGNDIKGKIFQLAARYENTAKKMKAVLDSSPYRPSIQPRSPDVFHLRLGASNFYVPPLTIDVNTFFRSGSLTGGALRQKTSPKFNSGYKETSIRMKLFFPNYEEIWGISIDDASKISLNDNYQIDFSSDGSSEQKIDKFLSSLRGLVAAFKYSPFLPIRNDYLNRVHGITAVALSSMSITTVPNFPFALAVDIELMNFNHKPFLPMINDFNQAIHWGKYRHFMGKAAGALHNYVNSSFLMKSSDDKKDPGKEETNSLVQTSAYENQKLTTNIVAEWNDGRNISFYVPAETQSKIFMPDTTSFRTDQEKIRNDYGKDLWGSLLASIGVDLNESADYGISLNSAYRLSVEQSFNPGIHSKIRTAIDIITAGVTEKDIQQKAYQRAAIQFISENSLDEAEKQYILNFSAKTAPATVVKQEYKYNGEKISNDPINLSTAKGFLKKISESIKARLDQEAKNITKKQAEIENITDVNSKRYKDLENSIKQDVKNSFNVLIYEQFYKNASIQQIMEAARARQGNFVFREWEVPMIKIDLDPKSVIVTGVSMTLGNNIAKLQLQMQDEPTYQHIGGKDTFINISMRVIGEQELNKIKRIFDHVNALARLEHSVSVIGFIGIKNIVTALGGVKYVIPSNYSVNTIPGYPHVYDVSISLLDFDIFQQSREKLSSVHQKQLIEEFGTKRNPFLRIKQMWGIFNAYPDFPLDVRNKNNEVVGHLDPDFYFRSFEMFDKDIINNFSLRPKDLLIPGDRQGIMDQTRDILNSPVANKILELIRVYEKDLRGEDVATRKIREQLQESLIKDIVIYLKANYISYESFIDLFAAVVRNPNLFSSNAKDSEVYNFIKKNRTLITESLEYNQEEKIADEDANYSNKISNNPYQVGNYSTSQEQILSKVQAALAGAHNLKGEENISFHLEDLDFVANIHTMPIIDPSDKTKIPAMLSIGSEVHLGYIDTEKDSRFYLTVDGVNIKKTSEGAKINGQRINDDFSNPTKAVTKNAIYGLQSLKEYGNPYTGNIEQHWEKMLIDTQYRDVSGRMIRAFPTYMLWLIDEGGYFAGVKVFDNFYGLQSIIDFSLVSSEDLLGDTLVIRVSNLYSKLTTKESTDIFDINNDISQDEPTLTDGLSRIIDRTLNKARYVMAHMKNDYVVNIENIRLKPGVRVHLRGGYGSNPNSLQTLFNGTITQVEQGEIVTITAQSDAIELGAIVNSTNKKGDSGKIDGGINTGLWLSEPRDLMVRLLSMGASRFRESIAYANRGIIFSENKFGIRHFGNILYEPMSISEEKKHYARIDAIADAYNAVGNFNFTDPSLRPNAFSLMNQLWSNFSSQRDLEIFKRNIYPGNGTGIAQFLGGDLGDGWTTVSSLTPEEQPNERLEYLSRLTDRSWNDLVSKAGQSGSSDAKAAIDSLVAGKEIIATNATSASASLTKGFIMGSIGLALAPVAPMGLAVSVGVGSGLLGVLSGRGGTNLTRMLGLTSTNDDDDMPGFDEVSFRAQTYMRSIWDLFKVCARLLPNYIVAVRPFEDRSTIFYGKPHWLYTSGVVPITTGMPNEEKMAELGLSNGLKVIKEDSGLQEIIDQIAKETSSYADQNAFLRSSEPLDKMLELASIQQNAQSYYAPAGELKGKIINFDSNRSQSINEIDPKTKKVVTKARLPLKKGNVTIGFHLPYKQAMPHKQIGQLPSRFRFPFFGYRGVASGAVLENYSFQYQSPRNTGSIFGVVEVQTESILTTDYQKLINKMYGDSFYEILKRDAKEFTQNELSGLIASDILQNSYNFTKNDYQLMDEFSNKKQNQNDYTQRNYYAVSLHRRNKCNERMGYARNSS